MDFQYFLEYVPYLAEAKLPALTAHIKWHLWSGLKVLNRMILNNINPKKAAVMMLFYPKNGITHLVLIVRNSYKGVHSAQIAFPGGKYENEI